MAEIEIDISLLSANPTDVDSPYSNQNANVILSNPAESSVTGATQSLITDIFAIGPSGPQGSMGILNTGELDLRYVNLTGDQTITGAKNFTTRPMVNTIPVLLSGEGSPSIEQYVKNDEGATIYKGQPVYVNGANGNNILIKLARNTGELTSSKTFGLLKQDLAINEFGYVVSEGALANIDTSMAGSEGDPIWLGKTGNLIYGLSNKPYAPNHLVYLGFVERKHQNQGKIFVKIQNGFELDELHNVQINHSRPLNNEDILMYNSASGIWFNQNLNTGIFKTSIENTGSILDQKINLLSGISVLIYNNQNIILPTGLPRSNNNLPLGSLWVDTSAGNVLKIVL